MSVRDDRPTSYDDLCTRLAADLETMPKRLAQTASYLVAHPDEVAFGTTASIAEGAGVQPSTLIRFAKANGFEGFSDLQLLFRERLRDRNQSYDSRLATLGQDADQVPSRAVLNGFIAAGQESLAWLQRDMDLDQFDAAAALLARAGTVYLVARRRAFPPLIQLRYALAKLGIRSEICGSVNGIDNDLLAFAGPDDAAILISFAPYTAQTIEAAEQMRAQEVPIVAITDSRLSPLCTGAGARLLLAEADYAGFRTSTAAMTLVMALSVATAEHRRLGRSGA
ncbi:MurR/RpiR family transcriptional regulator [Cereibacter sphaeroides]|uniref:MurR/RpiR family transcriptional regulator n=1 Tax=Cereibacter sphaeroides TaxID=1063 RepID=UPI000191CD1C|nr:MurR/RpiR family transcriptional regulator [Cereibacter sphaeroides]ACM04054.1 Transcriptional regulator, RpiR family [Cereibacter sphaeroides KD131]